MNSRGLGGLRRLKWESLSKKSDWTLVSQRSFHLSATDMKRQPNYRHHFHAHWNRYQVLELAKPELPRNEATTQNLWQNCPKMLMMAEEAAMSQPNHLEQLYGEQFLEWLERSQMIAYFHANSLMWGPKRQNFQNARRSKFELVGYEKSVCEPVLRNSKWSNLLHFTRGSFNDCYFAFSEEVNPQGLLKFIKKAQDLVFLGVVVHGRIIDKAQLTKLANMPSIDILHSELSTILQMPLMKTTQLLQSHPQKLSTNLGQYIKDQSKEE